MTSTRLNLLALTLLAPAVGLLAPVLAQSDSGTIKKFSQQDKFRQMEEILPTPTTYRTASGAPGTSYWQQRADYVIDVRIDDIDQRIIGSERIDYHNYSPDTLKYLWLQLDNNIMEPGSDANLIATAPNLDRGVPFSSIKNMFAREHFDGGVKVTRVEDGTGNGLAHIVVGTMMRIDLAQPLAPGESTEFEIDWHFNINNARVVRARTGYEFFEDDGNYIYEMAHWFPRMAAYTDVNGWQHKQFLGRGEFTLELGDYLVRITVPEDHIVGATGVLQNPEEVLTDVQRERFAQAKTAETPMFIVTPEEAEANESHTPEGEKTWIFKGDNVRDFAFASSRKFIWDAQGHTVMGNETIAMSYWPKEGEPLWSRYSTHAIIHTLDVYSRYTFAYPYPVAISVNGPIGGMEYPMICFNGPRPEEDGTYSQRTKYGLIGVIIHEVGHNYFPMIINSDERQWTWMDEGLNTFVQYLTEQEWEDDYPSRRGEPKDIVGYMRSTNQVPIMTNSESLLQFGPNGYAKPATALNILRETILGRELFDFAFKEYAQRWMFKRPQPSDLFRTMEDASGVDLDWFWRGWFYSTDHTDISVEGVSLYQVDTQDPYTEKALARAERDAKPETNSKRLNQDLPKRANAFPELKDFYNEFDTLDVTEKDRREFERFVKKLEDDEKEILNKAYNFYVIDLKNLGGLVMPVILEMHYDDGTTEEIRIPAEIWRYDNEAVSKLVMTEKTLESIVLDPHLETADVDLANNHYPRQQVKSRFKLFKSEGRRGGGGKNPMQEARDAEAGEDEKDEDANEEAGTTSGSS